VEEEEGEDIILVGVVQEELFSTKDSV